MALVDYGSPASMATFAPRSTQAVVTNQITSLLHPGDRGLAAHRYVAPVVAMETRAVAFPNLTLQTMRQEHQFHVERRSTLYFSTISIGRSVNESDPSLRMGKGSTASVPTTAR
jgi:hypothetical protein